MGNAGEILLILIAFVNSLSLSYFCDSANHLTSFSLISNKIGLIAVMAFLIFSRKRIKDMFIL
ncbi:hypothetical protein IO44_04170 [Gallibacterium anatis str. Avicor]|nr:hypothetical protein IO44_04170 [Gallibacterium anatis str. Avicor]